MYKGNIICHQLIDSIIKRGGQQVSDRYIIKRCLNQHVSSQKNIISNQLIKHSGVKSEFCTINYGLINQLQPKPLHKDQFMSKSLRTVYKKIPTQKIILTRNKCLSTSILNQKRKKKLEQKSFIETRNTFSNSEEDEMQQKKLIQLSVIDSKIEKKSSITIMRENLLSHQKKYKQQMFAKENQKEKKQVADKMQKNKFNRQLIGSSCHTYNEDGKYLIFSQNSKRKAIQKEFPIYLNPKIYKQQIISNKKENQKKKSFKNTKFIQKQLNKNDNIQKTNVQVLYENNNKRQTSSVQYMKIKQGICFTQPSTGKSIIEGTSRTISTSVGKQKQTFNKFFTSLPTQNIQVLTQKNICKNIIMKSKTQVCGRQSSLNKHYPYATTRSKAIGKHGKIRDVNQSLLKRLIVNI